MQSEREGIFVERSNNFRNGPIIKFPVRLFISEFPQLLMVKRLWKIYPDSRFSFLMNKIDRSLTFSFLDYPVFVSAANKYFGTLVAC